MGNNNMKRKKHFEPWEICEYMKTVAEDNKKAQSVPYTGMATACNYSLWKDWKFSISKLIQFNKDVNEYYEDIRNGFYTFDDLQEKILAVSPELVIYTVYYTDDDLKNHNKFMRALERKQLQQNNILNDRSVEYMRVFFMILIDYGWTEKKLLKAKDYVNNRIKVYLEDDEKHIMDLHEELLEGTGIYIEVPE